MKYVIGILLILLFCTPAYSATIVTETENWSLPSWITGWSPNGGIYLIWTITAPVADSNVNYDIRFRETSWNTLRWKHINTASGVYDWTDLDNQIATVAAAGKKYLVWLGKSALGYTDNVPQWVIAACPGTTTVPCEAGNCYTMWTDSECMGSKFKTFAAALASRYSSNANVKNGYAFYETNSLTGKGGVPVAQYTPFYKSILDTWVTNWGVAKTIAPADHLLEPDLNAYAVSQGVGIRSGWGALIYHIADSRSWLGFHYDKSTGYAKALSRPSSYYSADFEEPGPFWPYFKLNALEALARKFNWVTYNGAVYNMTGGTYVDTQCGRSYNADLFVPLRDYVRKILGYLPNLAPDAWALLTGMNKPASPNEPINNAELYLYQRDGITGGATVRTEMETWANSDTVAVWSCTETYDLFRAQGNQIYTARRTNRATTNDYIYFGVGDGFMLNGNFNVDIIVHYKDTGIPIWQIDYYNQAGATSTETVTNANSGAWKTARFSLTGAKFNNEYGQANGIDYNPADGDYLDPGEKDGLDFRIYNGGVSDVTISKVRLLRMIDPAGGDTVAPIITAEQVTNLAQTTETVTWTTDEPASSQDEYDNDSGEPYANSTTFVPTLVTSHLVNLTGLTAGIIYYYRVKSQDAVPNLATGIEKTFQTLPLSNKPVISSPSCWPICSTSLLSMNFVGTKPANTSVLLNGAEVVATNASTSWSYNVGLSLGDNSLSWTTNDGSATSLPEAGIVSVIAPGTCRQQ